METTVPIAGGEAASRARLSRRRLVLPAILVLAIIALAVSSQLRGSRPIQQDTKAFSLDFPSGYGKARSIPGSLAIANSAKATVVLLGRPNTAALLKKEGRRPLSVAQAEKRLHRQTCSATPSVTRSGGQTAVLAIAPRPCGPFESTAMVFGPKYRVFMSCSAPKHEAAVAACRQTLKGLRVK